jgi:hypothetical protein
VHDGSMLHKHFEQNWGIYETFLNNQENSRNAVIRDTLL